MKKLLVAIAIVSFCADANALLSGDTLQGVASIIKASKGNNFPAASNGFVVAPNGMYQQQVVQQNTLSPKEQTKINLRNQGYVIGDNDIVILNNQVQGYVSNEGWVVNPAGIVIYGPANKINQKVSVPKKVKRALQNYGYLYQNANQNNKQQFVMANGGQQWGSSNVISQSMLNNGAPASSDPQALPRFLKIIGEMAEDSLTLLEANIENEKVRNLVYKLLQLMIQSCTQQAADRSKLMKMRDSILELAKKADATQIAEKFDTIVKSTYKDNDLLISEDVEEREAERKKKLRKRKAQEENEEETSNKRRKANDDFDEGYDGDDEYVSDYY